MNATVDLRLPFAVRPLTPKLGAAIPGVKLADDMTDEVFRAIYQAFLRYQVLLFPPQDVPPARQVSFARRFCRSAAAQLPPSHSCFGRDCRSRPMPTKYSSTFRVL